MAKETVINLDPIDRKRKKGFIARLLITRHAGGKKVKKTEPYGHYMFCGPQRQGKTASVLWYAEKLIKKYTRKKYKVRLYSNFGPGKNIVMKTLFNTIDKLDPYAKEVRIFMIDEIHTYFPKDGGTREQKELADKLNVLFSQLGKRNTYILSTAQIYGRLDKKLREQCLYMVDCKISLSGKLINDFIPQGDILCDDLGRWAGNPKFIYKHGLSNMEYDTKRLIRE